MGIMCEVILMGMLRTKVICREANPVRCPRCRRLMVLVCVLPKFASLPEVQKYQCVKCGQIASHPAH
jgi:DNA-directed RNA polymerase subunit RPC12/RpoP